MEEERIQEESIKEKSIKEKSIKENTVKSKSNKSRIKSMVFIAVMAAVICVLGPLSLPIGVIPITFTNLAIMLIVYVLGRFKGTASTAIYLLIGIIGIPVFSGFSSGPAKLFGPTGGYLFGYLFLAYIGGLFVDKFEGKIYMHVLGFLLGTAVLYGFGTAWLAIQAHMSFKAALMAGVVPFIIGDLVKMAIAILVGVPVRKQIKKTGLV